MVEVFLLCEPRGAVGVGYVFPERRRVMAEERGRGREYGGEGIVGRPPGGGEADENRSV